MAGLPWCGAGRQSTTARRYLVGWRCWESGFCKFEFDDVLQSESNCQKPAFANHVRQRFYLRIANADVADSDEELARDFVDGGCAAHAAARLLGASGGGEGGAERGWWMLVAERLA